MHNHAGETVLARQILAGTIDDARKSLPQLVLFDLLFKAASLALLTPLTAALFRFLVERSGSHALGNVDIALFLLTPAGAGFLFVLVPAGFALVFLELSGFMFIGRASAAGRSAGWDDALRFAFRRLPALFTVAMLWLGAALLAAVPFLLGGLLVYLRLLTEHDINYYLQTGPPEFRTAVAAGVLLAAGAAVALALLFAGLYLALPSLLFDGGTAAGAMRRSIALSRKHASLVMRCLGVWILCWLLLSGALSFLHHRLGGFLVAAAGERLSALTLTLGLQVALGALVTAVAAFAGTAAGCLLAVRLHLATGGPGGAGDDRLVGDLPLLGEGAPFRVPRKAILAGTAALFAAALLLSGSLVEGLDLEDRVDVTAHRGSSLAAPENTLAAVERAVAEGADYAEIDVQETADGVLVVNHDKDLMRVAGLPLVVSRSTLEELKEVDVGARLGASFAGERIPTLREVVGTARGRIMLNVELKSYGGDGRRLAEKVLRLMEEEGMGGKFVVMSLVYSEVQAVRSLDSSVTVGFTPAVALGNLTRLDCDFLAVSTSLARQSLVAAAHGAGKEVHVWTVDEAADISAMIDRGVDNIITNDPAAVRRVLEERAALSDVERLLLRFRSLYL